MRTPILACLLITSITTGCGDDGESKVPPRVIAGGGIGDGPIDGVANIYVIDDKTREPIAGATVSVLGKDGITDADGLFILKDHYGPAEIAVKAAGYRSEQWIGANGANMTFNLQTATEPVAPRASLSGSIDLSTIQVPQGHLKLAIVAYSQTDDLGDPANEIKTANGTDVCNGGGMANPMPCAFTVDVRPGKIALIAAVYDRNLNGTLNNPNDDTMTLVRWAYRGGITVVAGVAQSGQDLTLVDVGNMNNVTVDFGTPPSGLSTVAALVGIDLGDEGVFQLPVVVTPTAATLLAPKLAAFNAKGYRLTAIANDGTDPAVKQSIVLHRDLMSTTLAAGAWLPPPSDLDVDRIITTFAPVAGATVHGLEFTQGTARLLNVTVFDDSTIVDVPDVIGLPAGAITVQLSAIGADGLDVTNFSLDADRNKLDRVSALTATLN